MSSIAVIVFILIGYLSGYAMWPTIRTIEIRQEWGQLPQDVSGYDVFLAVPNCDLIGHEAELIVNGDVYTGLVFDCAGEDSHSWMIDNMIAAEVDYYFWMKHPEYIGTNTQVQIIVKEYIQR